VIGTQVFHAGELFAKHYHLQYVRLSIYFLGLSWFLPYKNFFGKILKKFANCIKNLLTNSPTDDILHTSNLINPKF